MNSQPRGNGKICRYGVSHFSTRLGSDLGSVGSGRGQETTVESMHTARDMVLDRDAGASQGTIHLVKGEEGGK